MDPVSVEESIDKLPNALASTMWSNTHTTFSPNMCSAGVKTNVIPNIADIEVDIRTVPGDKEDEVRRHLDKALGDLIEDVTIEKLFSKNASVSPTGTPLWDVLAKVVDGHYPGAKLLPRLIVGFTDAPYFREHGAVAYGFGLFSRSLTSEAMSGRFHGNDERPATHGCDLDRHRVSVGKNNAWSVARGPRFGWLRRIRSTSEGEDHDYGGKRTTHSRPRRRPPARRNGCREG